MPLTRAESVPGVVPGASSEQVKIRNLVGLNGLAIPGDDRLDEDPNRNLLVLSQLAASIADVCGPLPLFLRTAGLD